MSAAGLRAEVAWPRRIGRNVRETLATLVRTPRPAGRRLAWPPRSWLAFFATLAIVTVAAAAFLLDARSIRGVRDMPLWLIGAFDWFTDFGLSGWFLWPTGLALIALAIFHPLAAPWYPRSVLAAVGVRIGFVFLAIVVPGLFINVIKVLVGRARPLVEGDAVWAYRLLTWQSEYASLPSGHATTAFSVLIALGALWPRARALLWAYAVLIAISRVVVTAHFPSDVIAGAIVGSVGALLVRNWFASRRLGFVIGSDGGVRRLPGPHWRHIKAVARRLRAA